LAHSRKKTGWKTDFKMKLIIDSFAWIEYLNGSIVGEKVKEYLSENEIYIIDIIIAEVISKVKRENSNTDIAYKAMISNSKIIPITPEIAKESGLLHAEIREKIKDFGLVDAFILLTARKFNAKILTGDRHFATFKEAILI